MVVVSSVTLAYNLFLYAQGAYIFDLSALNYNYFLKILYLFYSKAPYQALSIPIKSIR